MRKFLAALFLVAVVVTGCVFYGRYIYNAPGPFSNDTTIIIDRHAHIRTIADTLYDQKVIASRPVFLAAAYWTGALHKLKAGEYAFPAAAPMRTILDMMAKGTVVQHRLTIAEGLTSWQAVQIIDREPALDGVIQDIPAEGSLLPETYVFLHGDSRADMVARMQQAMRKTVAQLWAARAPDPMIATPLQAVTLAAIVEKETGVPSERPHIAGVFLNRLRRGMMLQSDPTTIYALTGGRIAMQGLGPLGRRLTTADLLTASPYNTYRVTGLPPGPIANPGVQALQAVLHPLATNDLYFVANGTGGHAFAANLADHERNVAQWRQAHQTQDTHHQ